MRPAILNPLFRATTSLAGVGPRVAEMIERLAGGHVIDLCLHLPSGLVDRGYRPTIQAAEAGRIATMTVDVAEHRPGQGRRPYRVTVRDETGVMDLIFFHARGDWLAKQLPEGATRIVSGQVERYQDRLQMPHPDFIADPDDPDGLPTVEPVYPMTAGLAPKTLRKAIHGALEAAPDLPEWLDGPLMQRHRWPGWREALLAAHAPESRADLEAAAKPRER